MRSAIQDQDAVLYEELSDCSGHVIDFLHRIKLPQRRRALRAIKQERGYQHCVVTVHKEKLVDALLQYLLPHARASAFTDWHPSSTHLFTHYATRIANDFRLKDILGSKVAGWVVRRAVLQASKRERHEQQDDRHARLRDFFGAYHASPSRIDLNAPSSGGNLRLIDSNPKGALEAFSEAVAKSSSSSKPANKHIGTSSKRNSIATRVPDWKQRASKARNFTESWELGRSLSTHASLESRVSSPTSFRVQSPTSRFSATQQALWPHQMRNSTLPKLESTSQSCLEATSQEGTDMQRSSSLPSLQRKKPRGDGLCSPQNSLPYEDTTGVEWRLPPAVTSPWRGGGSSISSCKTSSSIPRRYVRECELNFNPPKLNPFLTGHSSKLVARNQALNDCDVLLIATTLKECSQMDAVDLGGNPQLTEKSLLPFLEELARKPITKLGLDHCLRHAQAPGIRLTLQRVMDLLTESAGLQHLRSLNLSGIVVGMKEQIPLCQAIQQHPALLDVGLADIGIVGSTATKCISELLTSTTIRSLDLSWNTLSVEAFKVLGERILQTDCLKSLTISNCSSSSACNGSDNPCAFFLEYLAHNQTITHLDISMNRITFRGALVLEASLMNNMKLSKINLSGNPLGVWGKRGILRLISCPSSGLIDVNCEGCAGAAMQEALLENMQIFRLAYPGGKYQLDLARPYHRALLRLLYQFTEKLGLDPQGAFDIVNKTPAYNHPGRDATGNLLVPSSGTLTVTMSLEKLAEGKLSTISELDFSCVIKTYYSLLRQSIPESKELPLLGQWSLISGQHAEQVEMLQALGRDFNFTCSQLMYLCEGHSLTTEVLWRLLPSIVPGVNSFHVARLPTKIVDYIEVHKHMSVYSSFNADNPTGHYNLRLDIPGEYAVAEQLLLLDRWEAGISRRQNCPDISQRANYSNIRNERYQHQPLTHVPSLNEWILPEWDVLELDYVTRKRPPTDCEPLDARTFRLILIQLHQSTRSGCTPQSQVEVLRYLSHCFYISSFQLRELLGSFADRPLQAELVVMLYLRLTDIYNEKVVRARFDHQDDLDKMRARLGSCVLFPFIQPEHMHLTFNLAHYDERLAMHILISIVQKECPPTKLNPFTKVTYIHSDGAVDDLPFGVPRLWEQFERMPQGGYVSCVYVCAPEHRKFEERCRFLETYGGWSPAVTEDAVIWWADINVIPRDVVNLLYFLVTRFRDIWEAFAALDENHNKSLTFDEFQKGLQLFKCRKFKGEGQSRRMRAVFGFLDAGEEGTVTKEEWGILEHLFSEVQLSIFEFVQFLLRTFDDDLSAALNFIDKDGDGELTKHEWASAMTALGYLGPWTPIYNFLDKDGQGTIDMQEFKLLESYRESWKLM